MRIVYAKKAIAIRSIVTIGKIFFFLKKAYRKTNKTKGYITAVTLEKSATIIKYID